MAIIAQRYVQALFASSKNNDETIIFQKGLKDISELYNSNKELKDLLLNPCILNNEKLIVLKEAFPEYFKNDTFSNFLHELLIKDRISQIDNISKEYSKLFNSLNKELDIRIIVANKITDEQIKDIVNKYKEIYKANSVNYKIELDESIIGGVKVAIGDTVYDGTIETQLKQIF